MLKLESKRRAVATFIVALLSLGSFGACESDPADPARPNGEMVPIYFVDGHGLTAIYKRLTGEEVTTELFDLIQEGPGSNEQLTSFLPEETALIAMTETESDESLRLELSDDFWDLPAGERFAAAAQVSYTYASLEEGKRLLLLDGTVPGELKDASGEDISQPLTPDSFEDLRPWVQVQQPVAGAVVGHSFPVSAALAPGTTATIEAIQQGEVVGRRTEVEPTTIIEVEPAVSGEILLRITAKGPDGTEHTTEVPLQLAG